MFNSFALLGWLFLFCLGKELKWTLSHFSLKTVPGSCFKLHTRHEVWETSLFRKLPSSPCSSHSRSTQHLSQCLHVQELELKVHTAALPLPVSVAGGLWTPRTPPFLGSWVHIIWEFWRKTREQSLPGGSSSSLTWTTVQAVKGLLHFSTEKVQTQLFSEKLDRDPNSRFYFTAFTTSVFLSCFRTPSEGDTECDSWMEDTSLKLVTWAANSPMN